MGPTFDPGTRMAGHGRYMVGREIRPTLARENRRRDKNQGNLGTGNRKTATGEGARPDFGGHWTALATGVSGKKKGALARDPFAGAAVAVDIEWLA